MRNAEQHTVIEYNGPAEEEGILIGMAMNEALDHAWEAVPLPDLCVVQASNGRYYKAELSMTWRLITARDAHDFLTDEENDVA